MPSFQCYIFKSFVILMTLTFLSSSAVAVVKGKRVQENADVSGAAEQTIAPVGAPTREIQQIETKMNAYKTGTNLSPQEKANNAKIKKDIIHGTFDLGELCQLSLDKHWNQISPEERSRFVELMTSLLETKAVFSKEQSKTKGKSYIVKYLGDRYLDGKSKAITSTRVIVPKEDVKIVIEYKLKKSSADWKIYDIVVDDASLVENYRYQFDTIISKNGYPELVRRMQAKLDELRSK